MLRSELTDAGESAEDLVWIERTLVASIAIMRRSRREIARSRRRADRRRPEEADRAHATG
jgi:hypothetical protein